MTARRLVVTGRVQRVGVRAWAAREARRLGLVGRVRNRADASVELLIAGPRAGVAAMEVACARGPALAQVGCLDGEDAPTPALAGFDCLPTA